MKVIKSYLQRRPWVVLVSAVCVLAQGITALAADKLDTRNLIPNGSFERTDAKGQPVGWGLGGAQGLSWAIDEKVKHSGKQSLRITGRGAKSRTLKAGAYPSAKIRLRANRLYNLEVWVKAENVKFAREWPFGYVARFEAQTEDGNRVRSTSLCAPNGTYGWTRYSSLFKLSGESQVPETYRTFVPTVLTPDAPDGLSGTLWIDNVSLREIEVISAYDSVPAPELISHYKNALRTPDAKLALLFAPPSKKILRGMMPDEKVLKGGPTGSISLARNEYEGLQLVAVPLWGKNIVRKLEVSVSPLRNKQTGEIPADIKVTWHPIGYMGMEQKNGRLVGVPPWPDILLPAKSFSVRGQELQPIWLNVYAGENTPAGDYETQVTIKTSDSFHVLTARIDVHIYDFTIPREHSLPTAFGTHSSPMRDMLYTHRVEPRRFPCWAPEFHSYDAGKNFREFSQVKPYVETALGEHLGRGGSRFGLDLPAYDGAWGGGTGSVGAFGGVDHKYSGKGAEYIVRYHRQYAQFLREKGWFQDSYVYLWDEAQPHRYQNIRDIRQLIRQADPEIRCMIAGGLHEELDDSVDIWTVYTLSWDNKQALAQKLVDGGDEMWWYITNGPDAPPYATFHPDPVNDLLGARLMFWMVWKHRIQGFLFWSAEYWRGGAHGALRRIGDTTDLWWENGFGTYMGTGNLTYPNPGEEGQIWTTALEQAMRDGLTDTEHFILLDEAFKRAKAGNPFFEKKISSGTVPEVVKLLMQYTDNDPAPRVKHLARLSRLVDPTKDYVLSTIRLETIRDGLEDHEYFVLLEKAIDKAKARKSTAQRDRTIAEAEKLLAVPPDVVTSLTKWTHNDALMRQHRDQLARAIESLSAE